MKSGRFSSVPAKDLKGDYFSKRNKKPKNNDSLNSSLDNKSNS